MSDIKKAFDQLVLHYNTDTLLGNLAQALKRQAKRDKDKRRKNVIRAEAKVVEELADKITAGEIPWPGESDSSVYVAWLQQQSDTPESLSQSSSSKPLPG